MTCYQEKQHNYLKPMHMKLTAQNKKLKREFAKTAEIHQSMKIPKE